MAGWYALLDPVLSRLDAETAHRAAITGARAGVVPRDRGVDDPSLASCVWGRPFPNPIGLAAGFDKNAEVPDAMLGAGFGFVEIGTVTPRPQVGNPRPRLFRLPEDRGVINRMGFPGQGLDAALKRLAKRPRVGLVGVNVGANKDSADRAADYATCVAATAPYADYLVCNVSSPNTPGLRDLQGRAELVALLSGAKTARGDHDAPLLVKIAPDLSEGDVEDVVAAAVEVGIDGMVVGNTTLSRPADLKSPRRGETGGLSGAPLLALSTAVLKTAAKSVAGRFPLIGCGGVGCGADAYAKIRAGATLVQLYSALVYEGPGLVRRIKDELAALLKRDGFASVADAVGADL
ncbi:MAG: quinone-dependent dihydroorotate dehydrogenase [Rhodospirillales bacterium]|nr:MAG: quinone-dependent dihydroorotate dehydrogenase [Rhodospirillales bacterium]